MAHSITAILLFKFGKAKDLNKLLDEGVLYFNTIEYFRKCESESGRGDKNECLFLKSDNFEMYCKDILVGTGNNLTLYHALDFDNNVVYTHIYSMSAIFDNFMYFNKNKIWDPRLFELGDSVVIIHKLEEFQERVSKGLEEAYKNNEIQGSCCGRVLYNDKEKDFKFDLKKKNFLEKDNYYSYQNEIRLLISCSQSNIPYELKLGSIRDIAVIVDLKKFKNEYNIGEDGIYNYYLS